jgi:hypothetical protein
MRKKKGNRKQRWMNDIANFQIGWKRDSRHFLLHPYDVTTIDEHFKEMKRLIKTRECTRANEKIYFQHLAQIFALVYKAEERMSALSSILNDLI